MKKERNEKCEKCYWWERLPIDISEGFLPVHGTCNYEPVEVEKHITGFCSHYEATAREA